jgi:hypothetical protein
MKIKTLYIGIAAMIALFFEVYYLFEFTGFRTFAGIILLFFVPVYLILRNFELDDSEKIFFSIYISLGMYPLTVWGVNRIIPSLRASIFVTALVLIIIGFGLGYLKKK